MIMERVLFSASTLGFYAIDYPTDLLPSDVVEIDGNLWRQLLDGQLSGKIISADTAGHPILIVPPAPTPAQAWECFSVAIQTRLDAFAMSRGYDSGATCASYKGDPNPQWDSEANSYIAKRSQTWTKFYAIQDAVKSGTIEMPKLDELLLELPVLSWDDNV